MLAAERGASWTLFLLSRDIWLSNDLTLSKELALEMREMTENDEASEVIERRRIRALRHTPPSSDVVVFSAVAGRSAGLVRNDAY